MKVQNDIQLYAQILKESDEQKAQYIEACKTFQEECDNMNMNEDLLGGKIEPVVVDNAYIARAKKLLAKVKSRRPVIYNKVLQKLEEYKEQHIKLPPAEDFVETFVEPEDIDYGPSKEVSDYKDTDNPFGNADAEQNMYDSEELGEANVLVDDDYIKKATAAIEELKTINASAYNNALKYLQHYKGHQLAVDPETFAKNRIARAKAAVGTSGEIETISTPDDRFERIAKVAADRRAAMAADEEAAKNSKN